MKKWMDWLKGTTGKKAAICLICLLVIVLLFGNVYFYNRAQEAGMEVRIGRPFVNDVEGDVSTGVDFTNTTVIKDKTSVNTLLTAFLFAKPTTASDMTDRKPDAALYLTDPTVFEGSGASYEFSLWLEENFIIFAPENGDGSNYRELDSEYWVSQVKAIVEGQLGRNTLVSGT